MARTAITITDLPTGTGGSALTTVNIDATNHHVINLGSRRLEDCIIVVQNTFDGAKDITVKAGDSPPALEAGLGDLVIEAADGDPTVVPLFIAALSSGRFLQSDGTVNIDIEAAMTGTIGVLHKPQA